MSHQMDAPRPVGLPGMEEPPSQGRGCWFWGCCGCLATILALFLVMVVGTYMGLGYVRKTFTSDKAVEIPAVQAAPERYQEIKGRLDTFVKAVDSGKGGELVLTQDDINILISEHPDWELLKGKVYVKIEGEEIKADACIPIHGIPRLNGRYLNGTVGAKVSLKNGVFLVTPETIVVNGKPVPETAMKEIRKRNLARDVYEDRAKIDALNKFSSIEVKDGTITIKAVPAATPPADNPPK